MVENIGRDELRAKMDRGDPFVLLEVLAPQYYRHSHLPGASNLAPGKVAEMAPDLLPDIGGRDSALLLGRGVTHLSAGRP